REGVLAVPERLHAARPRQAGGLFEALPEVPLGALVRQRAGHQEALCRDEAARRSADVHCLRARSRPRDPHPPPRPGRAPQRGALDRRAKRPGLTQGPTPGRAPVPVVQPWSNSPIPEMEKGPEGPLSRWAWEDLNLRPLPYQGSAL